MRRGTKFVAALAVSGALALGAAAPALAGNHANNPPENRGTATACEVVPDRALEARAALGCEV